jgi:alpha-aminoadipate/glutamate carrier protein LysW
MNCLECDADIKIPENSIDGEIVTCPDCGASFEIAGKGLKKAEVIAEDWGQ